MPFCSEWLSTMEAEEPFINNDVFNVHDIAEIEGELFTLISS